MAASPSKAAIRLSLAWGAASDPKRTLRVTQWRVIIRAIATLVDKLDILKKALFHDLF
jgi:hypothetical protein